MKKFKKQKVKFKNKLPKIECKYTFPGKNVFSAGLTFDPFTIMLTTLSRNFSVFITSASGKLRGKIALPRNFLLKMSVEIKEAIITCYIRLFLIL